MSIYVFYAEFLKHFLKPWTKWNAYVFHTTYLLLVDNTYSVPHIFYYIYIYSLVCYYPLNKQNGTTGVCDNSIAIQNSKFHVNSLL